MGGGTAESVRVRPGVVLIGIACALLALFAFLAAGNFFDGPSRVELRGEDGATFESPAVQRLAVEGETGSVGPATEAEVVTEDRGDLPKGSRFALIVLDPEGLAVEGAEVIWLDPRRADEEDEGAFSWQADEKVLAHSTLPIERRQTDADGRVFLPVFRDHILVTVSKPGLRTKYGGATEMRFHHFQGGTGVITLVRSAIIRVQLDGDQGQELDGIPVAVVAIETVPDPWNGSDPRIEIASTLARARTDATGLALLEVRDVARSNPRYRVRLDFPRAEMTGIDVDHQDATSRTIQLELPPLARVRVACPEASTVRLPEKSRFILQGFPAGNPFPQAQGLVEGKMLKPGLYDLWPVGLSTELGVRVRGQGQFFFEGWLDRSGLGRFRGPTRAGEVLDVELSPPPASHLLRFRLLDVSGEVCRSAKVRCEFTDGQYELSFDPEVQILDEEGRGEVRVWTSRPETGLVTRGPGNLRLRHASPRFVGEEELEPAARLEIPAGSWPSTLELGDLRMAAPPVLLAGRVLDRDGRPIAAAGLHADRTWENSSPPWWYPARWHADETGRFEIRAEPEESDPRLQEVPEVVWAWAPGFLPARFVVTASRSSDLELRLDPAVTLELAILIDPEIDTRDLRLESSGEARDLVDLTWDSTASTSSEEVQHHGVLPRVAIEPLKAGTLDLVLRYRHGLKRELMREAIRLDDVTTGDLQQHSWDLRGRLDFVNIEIRNDSGEPIERARLRWTWSSPDGETGTTSLDIRNGRSVAVPRELVAKSMMILAEGHRAHRLHGVVPDRPILLRPAPLVRLDLSCDGAEVDARDLQVEFESAETGTTVLRSAVAEAAIRLPEAGRYTVRLRRRHGVEVIGILPEELEYRGTESELRLAFRSSKPSEGPLERAR